jgi:hypothetical protein
MVAKISKKPAKKAALTNKEEAFAQAYRKSRNKKQAAIDAGCPIRTAGTTGSRMYKKPHVLARIKELDARDCAAVSVTVNDVLTVLKNVAKFNLREITHMEGDELKLRPMDEWPDGADAAITGIKQSVKEGEIDGSAYKTSTCELRFDSRLTAARTIGDYLGMFTGYDQLVRAAEVYGKKLVDAE